MRRIAQVLILCGTAARALPAQTLTTLFSFDGTDASQPYVGLLQATNGYLYGTTVLGGAANSGTIFKISPNGALTTLYSFCSQSGCADGGLPEAGLVQTADGNLYGTTQVNGANGNGAYGTVFRIGPRGTLTTLYNFCSKSSCTDGANPSAGLVQGANGYLYGTTKVGGNSGSGTVFKITPHGKLTTLYSFCPEIDCIDGSEPWAGLVQATNGDLYGTTAYRGNRNAGTIFRITPSGRLTTLYRFCSHRPCIDGGGPQAGLVQAANGDLYGTTNLGGAHNAGTVFKITLSGRLTTLYSFCTQSGCTDGEMPSAALLQATGGDIYGTTTSGGAQSGGTIFKINPSGAFSTLYSFCSQSGCADGQGPQAALAQDTNGNLYGTTQFGGTSGAGTIFALSVGLGPLVKTLPTSGKAGAVVKILGTNLAGVTSLSFNGTPAAFTVVSSSLISTTVPAGASTGKVQVVTPGGRLSSNVPFRVRP